LARKAAVANPPKPPPITTALTVVGWIAS